MLKIIELFAGIGAQAKALENLGIEFESVVCEIDKYAYKSYCAIHGDTPNLGDITKIEKLPEADIWTWSYPCTSVSIAGKKEGMIEGSGTASSLGWEVIRLLKVSPKPKIMLMENVDAVLNKRNKPEFDRMCKSLEELGYTNNYKVLNAKDYGVAQNRKRCFMISALDGKKYAFPESVPLTTVLKDYLEDSVEEKYYLKQHQIDNYERFVQAKERDIYLHNGDLHLKGWRKNEQIVYNNNSIGATVCVGGTPHKVEELIQTGELHNDGWLERSNRVYSKDGIATTTTLANDSRCKIEEVVPDGSLNYERWYKCEQAVYDRENILGTITASAGKGRPPKIVEKYEPAGNLNRDGYFMSENYVNNMVKTISAHSGKGQPPMIEEPTESGIIEQGKLNRSPYITADRAIGEGENAPTVTCAHKGVAFPKVEEFIKYPTNNKTGFIEAHEGDGLVMQRPTKARGTVQPQQQPTLTGAPGGVVVRDGVALRIRYLTPLECWRLMGFDDEDYFKCKSVGMSATQLYKQSGNSIVVNVLMSIFENIFDGKTETKNNLDKWFE